MDMKIATKMGQLFLMRIEDTKRIAGKSITIFEKYLDDMMKEEKK